MGLKLAFRSSGMLANFGAGLGSMQPPYGGSLGCEQSNMKLGV